MKALFCLLWVLVSPLGLRAQSCNSYHFPSYSYPTYNTVYKYIEVIRPIEVFTPVFVPTFTVSYQQAPAAVAAAAPAAAAPAPAAAAPCAGMDKLVSALDRITLRLDALEKRQGPGAPQNSYPPPPPPNQGQDPAPPPAGGSGPSRLQVFRAKCSQCHTAGKLDPETTFVLLGPGPYEAEHTATMEAKLLKLVYRGEMPPKGNKQGALPLTDPEVGAIMAGEAKVK